MKKFSYKQSEDLCFKLNKFLEFVIVRFCGRCEGWTEGWAHGKKNEWNDKKRKWPHHNGDINKYISSKKQIESNSILVGVINPDCIALEPPLNGLANLFISSFLDL